VKRSLLRALAWSLRYWVFSIAAALAGIFALVFGGLAANAAAGDPGIPGWRWAAGILGASTIVLGLLQKILEKSVARSITLVELEAREDTLILVNGSLLPLTNHLATIASRGQADRRAHLEGMREACVASALELVSASDTRATYFVVSGADDGHRQMTDRVTRFKHRTDQPTTVFHEGDPLNAEVWDLVDNGEPIYFPDLDADRPESWPLDYRPAYKTFISVGVAIAGPPVIGVGLLTINALEAQSFSLQDVATIRLIAQILGTAEALCIGTQRLNAARGRTSSGNSSAPSSSISAKEEVQRDESD
jgi:hypothetical protein